MARFKSVAAALALLLTLQMVTFTVLAQEEDSTPETVPADEQVVDQAAVTEQTTTVTTESAATQTTVTVDQAPAPVDENEEAPADESATPAKTNEAPAATEGETPTEAAPTDESVDNGEV